MANDLEDFLRRAAAKRQANVKTQPRPPASPPKHQLTSHPEVIEADVIYEATIVEKAAPTAYDQVAYDETAFEHSDYQHKTFAREGYDQMPAGSSGSSSRGSAASRAETAVTTDELLELLRRPGGVKQAVLLKEILDRPDHRW